MLALETVSDTLVRPHCIHISPTPLDSNGPHTKLPRIDTPRGVLEGAVRQQSSVTEHTSEGGGEVNEGASAQSPLVMEKGGSGQQGEGVGQENRPPPGQEMTPEQIETLRRQVAVYCGICDNLMALHRAKMSGTSGEGAWGSCNHLDPRRSVIVFQ